MHFTPGTPIRPHCAHELTIAELTQQLAALTADRDRLLAERKLSLAIESADGKFAEQARRLIETMATHFDEEWRIKGSGEWRLNEIGQCVKALVECREENNTATDPAYDEWIKQQGPSYEEIKQQLDAARAEVERLRSVVAHANALMKRNMQYGLRKYLDTQAAARREGADNGS